MVGSVGLLKLKNYFWAQMAKTQKRNKKGTREKGENEEKGGKGEGGYGCQKKRQKNSKEN